MLQKLLMITATFALASTAYAGTQTDLELNRMENSLDQQANILMGPTIQGTSGKDVVRGVIRVIGELASRNERGHVIRRPGGPGRGHDDHGRGGRPDDGFGRHYRRIQCVAQNRQGQRFSADGYLAERVKERALASCERMTRDRRMKNSCRVISCFQARR
jgi:hypothetical protein